MYGFLLAKWAVLGIGLLLFTCPLRADENVDKRKTQATEVAEKFVKARLENDLPGLVAVTEVPFAGVKGAGTDKASLLTVIKDQAELKEALQSLLKTKVTEKKLTIKHRWTLEEFNKNGDVFTRDMVSAVAKQLDLRKDDIVINSEEDRFYIVRIRDGKAKLAIFFQ
jgi:hypothetical protein